MNQLAYAIVKCTRRKVAKPVRALLGATFLVASFGASAGPILQDNSNNIFQVNYFEPVGQTFVAQDASVEFGFFFRAINPGSANSDSIRFTLRDGAGLSGTVLQTTDFFLATGYNDWFDIDVSSVALTVGSSYTAAVEILGSSSHWGIRTNTGVDDYALGSLVSSRDISNYGQADAMFRVNPLSSVPAPGMLALVALGLLGMGIARRC